MTGWLGSQLESFPNLARTQPTMTNKKEKERTLSKSINCSNYSVFPFDKQAISLSLSTIDSSNPKLQWILPISPLSIVKSLASSSSSSLWHHFEELYPRIHRLHLQHCERWIRLLISFIYNIYQSYVRPSRMAQNSSEGAKISWDSAIPSLNISKKRSMRSSFSKPPYFSEDADLDSQLCNLLGRFWRRSMPNSPTLQAQAPWWLRGCLDEGSWRKWKVAQMQHSMF